MSRNKLWWSVPAVLLSVTVGCGGSDDEAEGQTTSTETTTTTTTTTTRPSTTTTRPTTTTAEFTLGIDQICALWFDMLDVTLNATESAETATDAEVEELLARIDDMTTGLVDVANSALGADHELARGINAYADATNSARDVEGLGVAIDQVKPWCPNPDNPREGRR